jgi:Uma2 family endonuclease
MSTYVPATLRKQVVERAGDRCEYCHHPYPEDIFWLIEFSNSSLAKDLEDKRRIYAIAGISN